MIIHSYRIGIILVDTTTQSNNNDSNIVEFKIPINIT